MCGNAPGTLDIKESPRGKYTEKHTKHEVIFYFFLEFLSGLKNICLKIMLFVKLTKNSVAELKISKRELYFSVWSV